MIAGPSSLATASLAHPAPGATLTTSSTTHLLPSITTPQDLNIARVDYFADGQPIGYRTQPPFHHWRHLLAPGSYVLTAKITDDHGFTTTTAPVTVNIVNGAPSVVYYHADAAGSPVAATDQAGSLVWIEDYRPWGERNLSLESGTTNGLWYTGKPVEDATGLVYLGARWYSPEIGRFYGVDPVDFAPDKPKSFNRYAYGNNNPYRFVDPDGRTPVDLVFLAADLWSFGKALYSGAGVGGAAVDVAISVAGVISPIPGARLAMKAGKAAGETSGVSRELVLSRKLHGEAAQHAEDAIRAGKPDVLTIDKAGALANRRDSIGHLPKVPGKHLDEYPPAMFREGGKGASVRPINPHDNMSAGACI